MFNLLKKKSRRSDIEKQNDILGHKLRNNHVINLSDYVN